MSRRTREIPIRELRHEVKKVKCLNPECKNEIWQRSSLIVFCSVKCKIAVKGYPKTKAVKAQENGNKQQIIAKKPTGELKLFLEIWKERKHVSELSGKKLHYLGHPLWINQFLHVLPKGKFPSMRLNKENILLATPIEHGFQDQYQVFTDRKEKLLLEIYNRK